MNFLKIIKDIKSLKIQGAQNVAKYSLFALKDIVLTSKTNSDLIIQQSIHHFHATLLTHPYFLSLHLLNSLFVNTPLFLDQTSTRFNQLRLAI